MGHWKKAITLAWPIVLGQLSTMVMHFTDVVFVGRLNHTCMAAAGVSNSVFFLVTILGMGIMMAVSALVSYYLGKNETFRLKNIIPSALFISIYSGLIFTTILYGIANNFQWLNQPPTVAVLAPEYLKLWAQSTLPLLMFVGLKSFCEGMEYTKPGMYIMLAGLLLNVGLNYILIYGGIGIKPMGFLGSATATLYTRWIMLFILIIYIFFHPTLKSYINLKNICNHREIIPILKLGFPTGLQYLFELGAFATAAVLIGTLGEIAGAAHQIAINLASLTYMGATGISAAGSIMVGNALGRNDFGDIKKSGIACLFIILIYMAICAILLIVFRIDLPYIFTKDIQVVQLSYYLLLITAFFQLSDGLQCVGVGLLRGFQDTRIPTILTLIAYWVIGIPLGYYLGFIKNYLTIGVWVGLCVGLTFSALVMVARFFVLLRKESKLIKLS